MEVILFTDQSTNVTGWAIFRDAKLFKYGCFVLSHSIPQKDTHSHVQRRLLLEDNIVELIIDNNVNKIVYEGIFQSPNVNTFKLLSKIQGSVECLAEKKHLEYEEFIVTQWRSYLPLKYQSKKPKREEIKQAIKEYVWDIYPETIDCKEDTLEAIAMGLAWFKKDKIMRLKEKVNEKL